MSNQFGKNIINTKKALFVTFPISSSTTSCDIYIPFPVYEIHIRGIDVDWQADYLIVVFFHHFLMMDQSGLLFVE